MTKSKTAPDANSTTGLTESSIGTSIETAMQALADIFVDEITQDDEVDGKLVSITRNRLWYLSSRVVNGFVWKLEQEMLDARKKMMEHSEILQAYENAEHGIVTQRMRDDKEYWLEQHKEAFYLAAIAFEAALPLHEQLAGRPFKTASERAAAAQANKQVVKARRPSVDVAALEKRMGLG